MRVIDFGYKEFDCHYNSKLKRLYQRNDTPTDYEFWIGSRDMLKFYGLGILNDEIEIIEEDKGIEKLKLPPIKSWSCDGPMVIDTINEIIDKLNRVKE